MFIPDDIDVKAPEIPWFEDASSELGVKGHGTRKSIDELKTEIKSAMSKLGGGVTSFISGTYPTVPVRLGFLIEFKYGTREGKIEVAALPMKKDTPAKRRDALKQALYTVRESLEAQFNSRLNMPGNAPLVGWLLDDQGRTLSEVLAGDAGIPLLTPPLREGDEDLEVVEGELVD